MFMKKKEILSDAELSAFCRQIAMVVSAGLPTYYGISILRDDAPDHATKALLEQIYIPMEEGQPLHEALVGANAFPEYMIHMIELGEKTGRLEEVLKALTAYYECEASIRSDIKHAVTYPLIMTVMMIAVIVVLIVKVLPVFAQIYRELGSGLSGFPLAMMTLSNALNKYSLILIVLFVLFLLAAFILPKTEIGKRMLQNRRLALSIAASRFANCMHLALASGLDTDCGLDLAEKLVNNPYMRERICCCRNRIKHGEEFSKALLMSGIFSKLYASRITIGSKTGAMDDAMQQIQEAYEEDFQTQLNRFISALEPTLVIILSTFIGLILISFLLPLLGIVSSIG